MGGCSAGIRPAAGRPQLVGVAVRMRDGAVLLADHYAPVSYRVFHSGPRPSAITMPVLAPAREVGEGSIRDGDGTQARETSL